jgi:hypothetical protein
MVPVLVCRACGGLSSSARFSYLCERLFCDHCGAENPQTNVRAVQTRDIFVRFITADGCSVQAVDLNLDRPLGPRVPVNSPEVLRRLLAYLGAMPEALSEYDRSHQSHGQGQRAHHPRARPQEPAPSKTVNSPCARPRPAPTIGTMKKKKNNKLKNETAAHPRRPVVGPPAGAEDKGWSLGGLH